VEVDYVIQPQGVSVFSPRLNGGERFVGFDKKMPFHDRAYMRIKARSKVLNLPLKRPELAPLQDSSTDGKWPTAETSQQTTVETKEEEKENIEPGEIPP
jgi:hypothetical protein